MFKELLSGIHVSNKKYDMVVVGIGVLLLVLLFINSLAIWPYVIEMSNHEIFQEMGKGLLKIGAITTGAVSVLALLIELFAGGNLSYRLLFGIIYIICSLTFLISMMALKLNLLILQSDSFVSNLMAWLLNIQFGIFMAFFPTIIAMGIAFLLRVILLAVRNAKGA